MRRLNTVTMLLAGVIAAGMLSLVPAGAATTSPTTSTSLRTAVQTSAVVNERGAAPMNYTPPAGVKYNNPLGTRLERRRILRHLLLTINSVPGKQKIRIATWNFRSNEIADALIAAHRRGVSVRVVIDRLNANPENPNLIFNRLRNALGGDANRAADMTSWARTCVSSCRAPRGIAHTKFYTFSKAGNATDVVIYGSFNATDLASYYQWNDVFTIRDRPAIYDHFTTIFDEMGKDTNVAQPFQQFQDGVFQSSFYPYKGTGTDTDPLLDELNKVVCAGATGGTGKNGYTKVRIAQTSMHGQRGLDIAYRLRTMWQRGCDIKIVYAVFGNQVLDILRHTGRGPVPMKQIVQDFDLDGVYDRYLHMKNMVVSGNYDGNTASVVTWNGSANWTSVALESDEIVMRIQKPAPGGVYMDWVNYLFAHPPVYSNETSPTNPEQILRIAAERGVDPYAKIEVN